jgi:hypothetical protein
VRNASALVAVVLLILAGRAFLTAVEPVFALIKAAVAAAATFALIGISVVVLVVMMVR